MKIILLKRRFDSTSILYAPELKLPKALNVVERCFPAVRYCQGFEPEYFYLLESEIGEYEEYSNHRDKAGTYSCLGGKDEIERQFIKLATNPKIGAIITASEAAQLWGLDSSTVKKACQQGKFSDHEARKSGGTWLVTVEGMERVYGPKPAEG